MNDARIVYIDTTNYRKNHEEVIANIVMAMPPYGVWFEHSELHKETNKVYIITWETGTPCRLICLPSIECNEFKRLGLFYKIGRTRLSKFLKIIHDPYNYFPEQNKKILQIQNDRHRNNTL